MPFLVIKLQFNRFVIIHFIVFHSLIGMDPAGPGFTIPWDYGAGTRLTENDARYVQCIHTASGTLGTHKDCGHANFIINGGAAQPGCLTPLCSHSKSHDYFDEAMFPGHVISGTKCSGHVRNFIADILGLPCSMDSERLGIYATRKRGRFFVTTNKDPPYAQLVMKVRETRRSAVKFADESTAESVDESASESMEAKTTYRMPSFPVIHIPIVMVPMVAAC